MDIILLLMILSLVATMCLYITLEPMIRDPQKAQIIVGMGMMVIVIIVYII